MEDSQTKRQIVEYARQLNRYLDNEYTRKLDRNIDNEHART